MNWIKKQLISWMAFSFVWLAVLVIMAFQMMNVQLIPSIVATTSIVGFIMYQIKKKKG